VYGETRRTMKMSAVLILKTILYFFFLIGHHSYTVYLLHCSGLELTLLLLIRIPASVMKFAKNLTFCIKTMILLRAVPKIALTGMFFSLSSEG
jgi:hypothetical protein